MPASLKILRDALDGLMKLALESAWLWVKAQRRRSVLRLYPEIQVLGPRGASQNDKPG